MSDRDDRKSDDIGMGEKGQECPWNIYHWHSKAGCKEMGNKPGSVLTIGLLNDGTLKIKLSDEEIAYQQRIEAMA